MRCFSKLPVPKGGLQVRWRGSSYNGIIGQGAIALNWNRVELDCILGRNLPLWGGETLKRVAREAVAALGGVQSQARWGFEQLGLVGGVPSPGREIGMRQSLRSFSTQVILWCCDSHRSPALWRQGKAQETSLLHTHRFHCEVCCHHHGITELWTRLKLSSEEMVKQSHWVLVKSLNSPCLQLCSPHLSSYRESHRGQVDLTTQLGKLGEMEVIGKRQKMDEQRKDG